MEGLQLFICLTGIWKAASNVKTSQKELWRLGVPSAEKALPTTSHRPAKVNTDLGKHFAKNLGVLFAERNDLSLKTLVDVLKVRGLGGSCQPGFLF